MAFIRVIRFISSDSIQMDGEHIYIMAVHYRCCMHGTHVTPETIASDLRSFDSVAWLDTMIKHKEPYECKGVDCESVHHPPLLQPIELIPLRSCLAYWRIRLKVTMRVKFTFVFIFPYFFPSLFHCVSFFSVQLTFGFVIFALRQSKLS